MTKFSKQEQAEAREQLRKMINPGDKVYTILRHVSRSGMTRWISCIIIKDGQPLDCTYRVAKALGWSVDTHNHEGVQVNGCGMDMGFHLVYELSYVLFGDGYSLTKGWL